MSFHIFQTWKTRSSLPSIFAQSLETWRAHHPAIKHELFDDRFVWDWLRAHQSKFPQAIHKGRDAIRTVDMFRYCYLFEHGGLYVDLDFFCLRPVDPLLAEHSGSVVLGSVSMPAEEQEHSIPNAWMYADRPGHPFWLLVIDLASRRTHDDYIEQATGPILLRDAVMLYQEISTGRELSLLGGVSALADRCGAEIPARLPKLTVLPPDVLYPLSWGYPEHRRIIADFRAAERIDSALVDRIDKTRNTHAFTYWYHSWGDDPLDF